jgi:predicted secreted hydrolase
MKHFQLAATIIVLLINACSQTDPACPEPDTDILLPQDESPHRNLMEWWYYTGHLWTGSGDRYGFEFTIFQTFAEAGDVRQVGYVGHFAISDPRKKDHVYDQKIIAPPDVYDGFDLRVDDWTIRGNGTQDRLKASMEGFAIDLTCVSKKPPAFNGQRGIIDMGSGLSSFYYSKTRMEVTGDLTVAGAQEPVTGMAWSDHQWGDFRVGGSAGWDWFSLQLDDRTELMLFLLHYLDGHTAITGGTFVDADGCHSHFSEHELTPLGTWETPHFPEADPYPYGWDLEVPDHDLVLNIQPTFEDQELDCLATTMNVYWEGEVEVTGTRAGKPVAGLGYVELAGYGPWNK